MPSDTAKIIPVEHKPLNRELIVIGYSLLVFDDNFLL